VPWEETFSSLNQFKEREAHCNVPRSHKEDGATLGTWVTHQRQLKNREKLDPYRQNILKDIGFEWVLVECPRESFADMDLDSSGF
jgi:hypothetical protein